MLACVFTCSSDMCVKMCVCVFLCVQMWIPVFVCVSGFEFVCVYAFVNICIYICVCVCAYVCLFLSGKHGACGYCRKY